MTENTEQAAVEATKTVIRPNLNNYVRAKSGSGKRTHRTDDLVARFLDGKTVAEVVEGGEKLGIDVSKWSHLNPGQQRMLVGNRIRHLMAQTKDPLTEDAVKAVFGEPAAPYDAEAAAAAKAKADEEKAAKKAAKDAEKAAKAAPKTAADAKIEPAAPDDAEPAPEAEQKTTRRRASK